MLRFQTEADCGQWKDWYRGDWLTGVRETRQMIQAFVHYEGDGTVGLH